MFERLLDLLARVEHDEKAKRTDGKAAHLPHKASAKIGVFIDTTGHGERAAVQQTHEHIELNEAHRASDLLGRVGFDLMKAHGDHESPIGRHSRMRGSTAVEDRYCSPTIATGASSL
jgi:hypothetical protein